MTITAPTRTRRAERGGRGVADARNSTAAALVATFTVAAVVAWLGYDGGAYGVVQRTTFALLVWWAVLAGVLSGFLPAERVPRAAIAAGGLLAAFTVWTGMSIGWAASAERAFAELDRAALYLGVFSLAVLAGSRRTAAGWADGLGLGIAAVGLLALASRLFPDHFPDPATAVILQPEAGRLDWPVNYANGLAILVALGIPFLLRAATAPRPWPLQALAVAPIPALAAAVYLTSSRGGSAATLIAVLAYLVLTSERGATVAALAASGTASAGAISVLLDRHALVNTPLEPAAVAEGRSAAALILGLCLGAAVLYTGLARLLALVPPRAKIVAGGAAAGIAVAVALVTLVAVEPLERFESFREPPTEVVTPGIDPTREHLLSLNGAGRWQYWEASWAQFRERPLVGQGAGSYEAWWAAHGEVAMFIRDAHSLYLETLGELGLIGFLLIGGAFACGLAALAARARRTAGTQRTIVAALGASFLAFAVASGIDWMWELTIVPVVGIACLGLLTGPGTTPVGHAAPRRDLGARRRLAARAALATVGFAVVVVQAILLLSAVQLRESRAASTRGDASRAVELALDARAVQPWAASPSLQVALVAESAGDDEVAYAWVEDAIANDPSDWRFWLVRARLETKLRRIEEARRSLARARDMNPRSPLFSN